VPEACSDKTRGLLLAIDLGTTLLKVGLFDVEGHLMALEAARYPVYRPQPDWIEQRPEDWYHLLTGLLHSLWQDGEASPQQVLGIGLSGRGGGGVFLDEEGKVLAPCWLDWRGAGGDYLSSLRQQTDRISASALSLASRLLWLRENRPDIFTQTRHALQVKDYILYRLTGVLASDNSAGPADRDWPAEVFAAVGFDPAGLPAVLPLGALAGELTRTAAEELGLRPGLPVSVGAHDGVCANIGAGMIELGQAALTLGTTGVVRVVTGRPLYSTRSFSCFHYRFLEGRWACGGDAIMAGRAAEWAAQTLAADRPAPERFATLEAEATAVSAGCDGLLFLPFLSGTVAPRPRRDATGSFCGLTFGHDRAHLFRAALEGVGYALRGIADELMEVAGPLRDVRVTGGGSRSRLWVQCLADILERPLGVPEEEASARGAALLLALALGLYGRPADAAAAMTRTVETFQPRPETAAVYRQQYERFMELAANEPGRESTRKA